MAFFVKVNAVSDEEGGANARTQPQNGPGGDHFTFFRDFLSILQKPAVHDTPRKMPSKMSEVKINIKYSVICLNYFLPINVKIILLFIKCFEVCIKSFR